MNAKTSSCMVQKLSHYVTLNDQSRRCIADLEKAERDYPRNSEVHGEGETNRNLFVVKSGWLYSYTDHLDGRRQIVKLHHAGDVIGFPDMAFDRTTTYLQTVNAVRLCPFPKAGLEQIFRISNQLSALFFTLAARDQVILIDLVRAIGRLQARERLAYLILDLAHKLRVTNPAMNGIFAMPLTQREIGDVIGLTNVYVSRSFMSLEEEGLVRRGTGTIEILDKAGLIELCGFVDRYDVLDTSWFPGD